MKAKSLWEIHCDLREKKVSSLELTKECLTKASSSHRNAFITLLSDEALRAATLADQQIARNKATPLTGIPFSLKDLFHTKDVATTAGSSFLKDYIAPFDSAVSERLKTAHAVLIGKNNLDEFAMGSTNETSFFGGVLHPKNENLVPGGSSGGSAVSVAEGSSLFSIGSDTGGSARLPAFFCELMALKPSFGRLSRRGQVAFATSFDQAAPIAHYALDIAMVMDALSAPDPFDHSMSQLKAMNATAELLAIDANFLRGKKVGVDLTLMSEIDQSMQKKIEQAMTILKQANVEIIDLKLEAMSFALETYFILTSAEAVTNLARFNGIIREENNAMSESLELNRTQFFGNEVKRRLLFGNYFLSSSPPKNFFLKAQEWRKKIQSEMQTHLNKCDVVLLPISPVSEIYKNSKVSEVDRFNVLANLSSYPAITSLSGIQFIAGFNQDEFLLKFAHAIDLFTHRVEKR